MTDDDFKLLRVLITDERTDRQKDICDCRVTFATEKNRKLGLTGIN